MEMNTREAGITEFPVWFDSWLRGKVLEYRKLQWSNACVFISVSSFAIVVGIVFSLFTIKQIVCIISTWFVHTEWSVIFQKITILLHKDFFWSSFNDSNHCSKSKILYERYRILLFQQQLLRVEKNLYAT